MKTNVDEIMLHKVCMAYANPSCEYNKKEAFKLLCDVVGCDPYGDEVHSVIKRWEQKRFSDKKKSATDLFDMLMQNFVRENDI